MAATSLFESTIPPWRLALYVFAGALVLMLGGFMFSLNKSIPADPLFAWSIATAFLLLFAIFNSVLSLNAVSFTKYWSQSMYSYLGLALCTGASAWLFSGVGLNQAGSYKFIYLVITFGFLVFLSLVNFARKIMQFIEREEWTQPQNRKK
jgi:hypothetical protein